MKIDCWFNLNPLLSHSRITTADTVALTANNVSGRISISRSPLRHAFILIPLVLGCFALSPLAQAAAKPSPTPGPQDVNVVNTPTVSDTDNPAKQPFQATAFQNNIDAFAIGNVAIVGTVPQGKRLIIEHVSVLGTMASLQELVLASIEVTNSGHLLSHLLTITAQGSAGSYYVSSQEVRLYADAGTTVFGSALRGGPFGLWSIRFTISGYLVDAP